MDCLTLILVFCIFISILLTFISYNTKMSAMEIVNDMGLGWNMANTFECYSINEKIEDPEEIIKLWGNEVPTKNMFIKLKKYGFKTIRFPITWMNFMDDSGKVDNKWMSKIKEVVDLIIDLNMYCIINIFHDGSEGNWLSKGLIAQKRYIILWEQIAENFKDYDEHLIFESMNHVQYNIGNNYDFDTLFTLTQSFVDTIRSSKGNNKHRLLLITGADTNLDLTCSEEFKLPKDPSNKLAVSIHYYNPSQFTIESKDDPYTWVEDGVTYIIPALTQWGSESEYKDIFSDFEEMKNAFTDKGIPVILGEIGVLTEENKEIDSIRDYLYTVFSMSAAYEGIMSCLMDKSNKIKGNMNYYDRVNDKWYDEIIQKNFKKISRGKFINPKDYYIY